MTRATRWTTVATCALLLGAVACGDGEMRVDGAPAATDGTPVGTDGAIDASDGGADARDDGRPTGRRCSDALPMTPSSDGTTWTASGRIEAAESSSIELQPGKCVRFPTPGAERFYSVTLQAGATYVVTATAVVGSGPTPPLMPIVYAFTDCGDAASSCLAGASAGSPTTPIKLTPSKTGRVIIAVDSPVLAGTVGSYGAFSLTVERVDVPPNDRCAAATALSLSNGKASAPFDLSAASDTINLGAKDCARGSGVVTPAGPTPGPDVFFSLQASAGKIYRVSTTPSVRVALYALTDCSNAASSCLAGDVYHGSLQFRPTTSGTVVIGVDSAQPALSGPPARATLVVEEITPPSNDTCTSATLLGWSNGKATISGSLVGASNSAAPPFSSCIQQPTFGPDLFYALDVSAGKGYRLSLSSTSSVGMYVFGDCADIAGSCVGSASPKSFGSLLFVASATGRVFVAVDEIGPIAGASTFTLDAEEFSLAPNATCAGAQQLTLSAGKATVTADTSSAGANDLAGVRCSGQQTFDGPQLYYRVSLAANTRYLAQLSGFDGVLYAYPASAGCDVKAINPACYYTFSAVPGTAAKYVQIAPTADEDWIIVVDSTSATRAGAFSLSIEALAPPANDTCANATPLAIPSGGSLTSVIDHTYAATDTVDLASSACTGAVTAGPDVFYSINVQAGRSYTLTLRPSASIDLALYAFTDCAQVAGTCGASMGSDHGGAGQTETITFTPASNMTLLVAVDGRGPLDVGPFELVVTAKGPPPANDTCSGAQPLSFDSNGVATVSSDNVSATNTLSQMSCVPVPTAGSELFYSVQLTANQTYRVSATFASGLPGIVYVLPSCAAPQKTCLGGAFNASLGAPATYTFTPTTSGNYVVVVDRPAPGIAGAFTLEIQ